jgi:hypothetical protein
MYNFRIKEDAVSETKKLEEEVAVIVKTTLPEEKKKNEDETKGKRQDHDALPDDIKAMFLENLNIFPRMRKLHEQLKLLAGAKACDRYPFLQQLVDLDKKLRSNWDTYDGYDASSTAPSAPSASGTEDMPSAPPASEDVDTPPLNEMQDEPSNSLPGVKEINAARKYLSENKAKLSELKAAGETAKFEALLTKVQQRLDILISSRAGIREEQLTELISLGCHV